MHDMGERLGDIQAKEVVIAEEMVVEEGLPAPRPSLYASAGENILGRNILELAKDAEARIFADPRRREMLDRLNSKRAERRERVLRVKMTRGVQARIWDGQNQNRRRGMMVEEFRDRFG